MPIPFLFKSLVVLCLQILIFNHLLLFREIIPYIYLTALYLLPLKTSRIKTIFFHFFFGMCVDFLTGTSGLHTTACLIIGYLKPIMIKISFKNPLEIESKMSSQRKRQKEQITYLALMIGIHHTVLISLDILMLQELYYILRKIVLNFAVTLIFCVLIISIFRQQKSRF